MCLDCCRIFLHEKNRVTDVVDNLVLFFFCLCGLSLGATFWTEKQTNKKNVLLFHLDYTENLLMFVSA